MATENIYEIIEKVKTLPELDSLRSQVVEGDGAIEALMRVKRNELEAKAKLRGEYYENAERLWEFRTTRLVQNGDKGNRRKVLSGHFDTIARDSRPSCYHQTNLYEPTKRGNSLEHHDHSVGTNSLVSFTNVVDVFGCRFNKQRAHNAPDGPTCAPSWGHAAEGALGKIGKRKKMKKRLLLIMGSKEKHGKDGFRFSPHNFIRFSSHADIYDNAPHVMFVPIMEVSEIKAWDNEAYEVLVAIVGFDGKKAEDVYTEVTHSSKKTDLEKCSTPEIRTATESLQKFMLGLAASLLQTIPIKLNGNADKQGELESVRKDIEDRGVFLPHLKEDDQSRRPVMKLKFGANESDPKYIPDPWMLMTKAAVNLSWWNGQKLLPACKPPEDEDEGDRVFWQNMAEYEMRQRQVSIPTNLVLPATESTPREGDKRQGPTIVTSQKDEDWEFMDD